VGLCVGALGIVMQASRSLVAGYQVPWGLILTLVVTAIVVRSAGWYVRSRSAAALVAIGWVAATIVLALTGPGGDILLPSITRSWIYLIGGLVVVLAAAILPLPQQDAVGLVTAAAVAVDPGDDAWRQQSVAGSVASVPAETVPADANVSPVPTAPTGADADDR
jgi:hypothetical protein